MLSIPGKVFLLGEYAVLTGTPAWVTTVPPRFVLQDGGDRVVFHPQSPAGKFLAERCQEDLFGQFIDPWAGRGGFGGSTAEFAFVAYLSGIRTPLEAWRSYRELSRNEPVTRRPSGADLIGQWHGGSIEWDPRAERVNDLTAVLRELPVLIFSATHLPNRKTVTHSHLEAVASSSISFDSLLPSLARARAGAEVQDWMEVGRAFSAYADSLAHLNLESPVVRNERLALSRRPGVIGVKGCGSLQTDAMLVVVDSLASVETDSVIVFAEQECGLKLLSRGLPHEPGLGEGPK